MKLLYEEWLQKALNDLKSSEKLLSGDKPILATAIYHTQQCAEKALKAYLVYKMQDIEKTHDIEKILYSCSKFIK